MLRCCSIFCGVWDEELRASVFDFQCGNTAHYTLANIVFGEPLLGECRHCSSFRTLLRHHFRTLVPLSAVVLEYESYISWLCESRIEGLLGCAFGAHKPLSACTATSDGVDWGPAGPWLNQTFWSKPLFFLSRFFWSGQRELHAQVGMTLPTAHHSRRSSDSACLAMNVKCLD